MYLRETENEREDEVQAGSIILSRCWSSKSAVRHPEKQGEVASTSIAIIAILINSFSQILSQQKNIRT
jgi:hypothetical protein